MQLFLNMAFKIEASLLGRGWLLVTAPGLDACVLKAIGLGQRAECYHDYLRVERTCS